MRALIINNEVKERIKQVVDYAHAHVISHDDLKDMVAGKKQPPGDFPEHVCHIQVGFRVVYSEEDNVPEVGRCRHISILVDGKKGPNPHAVIAIAQEFGFRVKSIEDKDAFFHIDKEPVFNVSIIEPVERSN